MCVCVCVCVCVCCAVIKAGYYVSFGFSKGFFLQGFPLVFPRGGGGPHHPKFSCSVLFVFGPPACFLFLFSVGVVCVGLYVSKNVQRVHNRPETQSVLCKGVGACYGQFREGIYCTGGAFDTPTKRDTKQIYNHLPLGSVIM